MDDWHSFGEDRVGFQLEDLFLCPQRLVCCGRVALYCVEIENIGFDIHFVNRFTIAFKDSFEGEVGLGSFDGEQGLLEICLDQLRMIASTPHPSLCLWVGVDLEG